MTELQDKYRPTEAEQKLVEVMMNPDNLDKSITDICGIAKIDRGTYYNAFDKEGFNEYYQQKGKDLISQAVMPTINATKKYARREKGHNDRKLLLEMAKTFTPELTVNVMKEMSDEELATILKEAKDGDN